MSWSVISTAFLGFEQDMRGPLKKCLRELASLAGGCAGVFAVRFARKDVCMCLCTARVCFLGCWGIKPLREVLAQQKSLAVGLYDKLSAFLGFEQDIRGPLKK
jgi:hypothetical protein